MNAFTKEFWEDRAKRFGHTGHSEPFLYCFDQEARKYAINTILAENNLTNKKNALDFGCGSGDFTGIINQYAEKVLGYDISEHVIDVAKVKFQKNSSIQFTASADYIKKDSPFELIVIIGVLQTFTNAQLSENLELLNSCLASGGNIICMEFFRTAELQWQNNEKASKDDWFVVLKKNKLELIKEYSFYNPHLYPSKSWKQYKNSLYHNLLKLFKGVEYVQRILSNSAKQLILKEKDVLGPANDIFKIYVLQKQ